MLLYGILSLSENDHSKDFIVTPHQNWTGTKLKGYEQAPALLISISFDYNKNVVSERAFRLQTFGESIIVFLILGMCHIQLMCNILSSMNSCGGIHRRHH